METLIFVLGFIIAALGTSFLLYYLKTRKLLRNQCKLMLELTSALFGKVIDETRKEPVKSEPCDNAAEPARQDPGNTAGPCAEK